ncbi:MAG: hypothetical protein ACLVBP_00215 [Ruminococcus sp.]
MLRCMTEIDSYSRKLYHGSVVWPRAKEMMDWDENIHAEDIGNGKVRGVGACHGHAGFLDCSNVDVGGADYEAE